jgi:site-specific DNA recombinase
MGYQCENGSLVIVPEQAEVVKAMFELYLDGMTMQQIKEYLESQKMQWAKYTGLFKVGASLC